MKQLVSSDILHRICLVNDNKLMNPFVVLSWAAMSLISTSPLLFVCFISFIFFFHFIYLNLLLLVSSSAMFFILKISKLIDETHNHW